MILWHIEQILRNELDVRGEFTGLDVPPYTTIRQSFYSNFDNY